MEWLTGYVVKICAAALISFVVDMLLPEGNIKRTARFCCVFSNNHNNMRAADKSFYAAADCYNSP